VSQVDPLKNAQTVQILDAARAASTATRVRMIHPDWEDDQVDAEVRTIKEEDVTMAPPIVHPFLGADMTDNEADDGNGSDPAADE
jgi:hypothetical protein